MNARCFSIFYSDKYVHSPHPLIPTPRPKINPHRTQSRPCARIASLHHRSFIDTGTFPAISAPVYRMDITTGEKRCAGDKGDEGGEEGQEK